MPETQPFPSMSSVFPSHLCLCSPSFSPLAWAGRPLELFLLTPHAGHVAKACVTQGTANVMPAVTCPWHHQGGCQRMMPKLQPDWCKFDFLSLYQCPCGRWNISPGEQQRTGGFHALVMSSSGPLALKGKGTGHTVCCFKAIAALLPGPALSCHVLCPAPSPLHLLTILPSSGMG